MRYKNHHISLPLVWLLILFVLSGPVHAKSLLGQTAGDFTLADQNGKKHSLAEMRKKGHVLLIFWAVECVYCYAHIKEFKQLYTRYYNRGLTLAGINIGGEYPEDVAEYVKDNEIPYITLAERLNNLDVADAYQAQVTPTMVLVSPEGKIVYYGYKTPDIAKFVK